MEIKGISSGFRKSHFSARRKIKLGIVLLLIIGSGALFFGTNIGKGLLSKADVLASGATFPDVPTDYWAYLQIEAAYRGGIVQGYPDGSFKPEVTLTDDQIAVFLARAVAGGDANVLEGPATPSFRDVPEDYWAYKYIEYCKSKEIMLGTGGYFNPLTQTSRETMAIYLASAVAGGNSKVPEPTVTTPTFPDVPSSLTGYKYIEYLYSLGIVKGYPDGNYQPAAILTRAQMTVYISNAFDLISTALVANISGKVTTSTGAILPGGYIVIDEGEDITQIKDDGTYNITGLDATTYEVEIYDVNGNLYENPEPGVHLISPIYGNNTVNFSGLVQQ